MEELLQKTRVLLVPAIILIAAWICLYFAPSLPPAWAELLRASPYIAAVAGMLLAVHFHRGRPFILLLVIAVFYWCFLTFLPDGVQQPAQQALFHALCCLIPVNAFAFAVAKERGVFTEVGKLRLLYLGGQAFLAYLIFHYNFRTVAPLFNARLLTLVRSDSLAVSQFAFILFVAAVIGIMTLAVIRKAQLEGWILGLLAALFVACNWIAMPHAATVFSLAACSMVIMGILQDSYNMAFRDDLTGIASRRALNEALYGLGNDFAIAMVDVDHFKQFNDTHGHDVGDQVLKLVAKKLSCVDGGGRSYRYGGEEFTILFPGQGAAEVVSHLERLRQEIADYKMIIRGEDRPKSDRKGRKRSTGSRNGVSVTVTVSIGVAENGRHIRTPEEVLIAADKALYMAKQQGRNRVCLSKTKPDKAVSDL